MKTYVQKIFISVILFITCLNVFPQAEPTASVGAMDILFDVGEGIKISVYDVFLTGMKGREVTFGMMLYGGEEWVEDSWIALNPEKVLYATAQWEGEAFWFTYKYSQLREWGAGSFWAGFFIIDTKKDTTLHREDFQFNINGKKERNMNREILGDYNLEIQEDFHIQGWGSKIRLTSLENDILAGEVWIDWGIGAQARMPMDWEVLYREAFSTELTGSNFSFTVLIGDGAPKPQYYEFNLKVNGDAITGEVYISPAYEKAPPLHSPVKAAKAD